MPWEGLYLNPLESAVILSVDEKPQVQPVAQSRPAFLMMPGTRRPQPGQSMEPESQTLIWTKTQNKSWKLSGGL
jgi:hypothetical protein